MAEPIVNTSAQATGEPKTSNMQRPTSLTVTQAVSSSPPGAANNGEAKTPSPVKQQTQTTIIQIPPSPNQTKFSSTSPASVEAPTAATNAQQPATSVSFIEMASSFFRWGGKGGNSSATVTSQPEINASKLELSPKSVTVDVEVSGTEQLVKSNKALDKVAQAPVINVITNPNENLRISNTPNPSYIVSGPSGKQRTSRKTMRAPQPPILDTPKIESKISNQGQTQQTSPIDAADVQEKTEEKLLKLLSDFNSGKVSKKTIFLSALLMIYQLYQLIARVPLTFVIFLVKSIFGGQQTRRNKYYVKNGRHSRSTRGSRQTTLRTVWSWNRSSS